MPKAVKDWPKYLLAIMGLVLLAARPGYSREHSESQSRGILATIWTGLVSDFDEFVKKVDELRRLDEDAVALRGELAQIDYERSKLERELVDCRETKRATRLKAQAKSEGGFETSRTIASIELSDETLLSKPPRVIFEASVKAFNSNDFETAAKGLSKLVENSENDAFQNSRTFYLAGVSLYKLGNYKRAAGYFEKAKEHAHGEEISYAPRALAWMALCHERLGNKTEEKKIVQEILQKYPKSKEAQRLNRNRGKRNA